MFRMQVNFYTCSPLGTFLYNFLLMPDLLTQFISAIEIQYIKENKIGQLKFGSRFERLRHEIA